MPSGVIATPRGCPPAGYVATNASVPSTGETANCATLPEPVWGAYRLVPSGLSATTRAWLPPAVANGGVSGDRRPSPDTANCATPEPPFWPEYARVPAALIATGPGVNWPPTLSGDLGVSVPSAATEYCSMKPGWLATGTYTLRPSGL